MDAGATENGGWVTGERRAAQRSGVAIGYVVGARVGDLRLRGSCSNWRKSRMAGRLPGLKHASPAMTISASQDVGKRVYGDTIRQRPWHPHPPRYRAATSPAERER
jgi:hypothetical protein